MRKFSVFLVFLLLLTVYFFRNILFTATGIAGNFGDVFLHYYPLKHLVSEHLISGKMPLWNPYIFAGQPLLANPQSAVFYPFSILFSIFPLVAAFNYFYVIHIFLAGIFAYLLLKYLRFSETACFIGSVSWAFSSFMLYTIPAGHPVMLSGFIWLPLAILFTDIVGRSEKKEYIFLLSLVFAFLFLSGHFQPVYAGAVLTLFFIFKYQPAGLKRIFLSAGFALLIAALQLIPTAQLSRSIENSFWPALVQYYSLPLKNLINLALPNYFGNIVDGNYVFPDNASFFFERHGLYFGVIPLLLSIVGIYVSVKRGKYLYILLAAAGILLATGIYTRIDILYRNIPGLDMLRVPARFYCVSLIGFILLAVSGWDHLKDILKNPIKIVLIFLIVFDLFWWHDKFIYSQDMTAYKNKSELGAYINPVYRIATEPDKLQSDKAMMYHQYNVNGYEAIFLKKYVHYLGFQEKKVMGPTGLARIDLLSPMSKGLSVGYYITSQKLRNFRIQASLPSGITLYRAANPLPRVFLPKKLAVIPNPEKNFEYHPDQLEFLNNTKFAPNEILLVTAVPQDFPLLNLSGRILSYSSGTDKLTSEVLLPSGGTVLFSEIYYPGWSVYADRKKYQIYTGNMSLRAVFLPPGEYYNDKRIYMYFHPAAWLMGLYITLVSIFLLLSWTFFAGFLTKIPDIDMILKRLPFNKDK
ncbi:MAG: hypothetical protein ABII64_03880 [Elusimicrobiota bacterium]